MILQTHRTLGLSGVFSIAAGAMISSGLFVLPGLAYAKAGPAMVLAYLLASALVLPEMLAKAEIVTAMPRAGGNYFYIMRSLGPLLGTLAGLADWLAVAFKTSFALIGLGTLAEVVWPGAPAVVVQGTAIGFGLVFAVLNCLGTRGSGRVQVVLVAGLIAILAAYAGGGLRHAVGARFLPLVPHGWQHVFEVSGMVFVSFAGLTKAAAMAEEVKDPTRNLPFGMFLAFGVVSSLYFLVTMATVGIVDGAALADAHAPLLLGAATALGPAGPWLVGVAAFLAFATTGNAGIMAASRAPLAMGRDGLVPKILTRASARHGAPVASIVVTTALVVGIVALLDVESLVKTASTMMIITFVLINLSLIVLRESGIENYRPTFRAPLYPWPQVVAMGVYAFLIVEMGRLPLLLTAGFAGVGLVWYFAYVRRRIQRDSAFVVLVGRILNRHMRRAHLNRELVQILLERDRIEFDRFDRLAADCPILDVDASIDVKELFRRVAAALPARLNLSDEQLYELFLEREREASTVVHPGLAIPHIVVPGESLFELVLVRCRQGIIFSELHAPVHTAFVLVGSHDERNFHLRALMNIAHIVQEEGFEANWLAARSAEQLRDLVLLSQRRRDHAANKPATGDA